MTSTSMLYMITRLGNRISYGLRLQLCTRIDLICNTVFQQKEIHTVTWAQLRSRHGNIFDYIINRTNVKPDIFVRFMRLDMVDFFCVFWQQSLEMKPLVLK